MLEKIKILIADDEKDVLLYLKNILERSSYVILTASTGEEAISLAKREIPNLIILDIILPDMDGGEVAVNLEENPTTSKIPIIFVTGIITKEEETKGLKTGKHYVLAKPVSIENLHKTISAALGN